MFHLFLERRELIQKHGDVPATDAISPPHEVDNEKNQEEPLEEVEDPSPFQLDLYELFHVPIFPPIK